MEENFDYGLAAERGEKVLMMRSGNREWARGIGLTLALALAAGAAGAAESTPPVEEGAAGALSLLGGGRSLWELFLLGGWVMWPILGVAVIGMAFVFERLLELRIRKHCPRDFDKDLIHIVDARGTDAGLALCLERQSSLSRVLYSALLRYGASRQEMLEAISDEGARLVYDLRRNCRTIGVMSLVAPLWGLLGLLLGLLDALDRFASAPEHEALAPLAGGTAVALLPLAFGLLVGIPLLKFYFYLRGKAEDIVREIGERATDAIITLDRKARRSIRQIEDIEENLETKDMLPPKIGAQPDLDHEFEDPNQEKSIKTSVTTPAHLPVALPKPGDSAEIDRESVTKVDFKALAPEAKPPREIEAPSAVNPEQKKA